VVELYAVREDDWLEVTVRDRGEAFGKGSIDGLGLGLSIIARLAGDLRIVQKATGPRCGCGSRWRPSSPQRRFEVGNR
jgi:anti-sigma regulatory factor (Ser/Thr protein kinase)